MIKEPSFLKGEPVRKATTASNVEMNFMVEGTGLKIDTNTVVFMHYTGYTVDSVGAKHVFDSSFDTGKPFPAEPGKGKVINPNDKQWSSVVDLFPKQAGTRQIIDIDIEMVQTSCGMSIPYFDFKEERLQLDAWAQNKGEEGIKEYWREKNEVSIDGIPTQIQEGY